MRMFLASTQMGFRYKAVFYPSVPRLSECGVGLLDSHWSLPPKQRESCITDEALLPLDLVMDSGAHTFQQLNRMKSKAELRLICDDYLAYIRKAKGRFLWFAEMDVDITYGVPFVEGFLEELEGTGATIMRVWHRHRGIDAWKAYCKRYRYVGISFLDAGDNLDAMARMCQYAYDEGCLVHGFGGTDFKKLLQVPVYSVDSTTWGVPMRYGVFMTDASLSRLRICEPRGAQVHPTLVVGNRQKSIAESAAAVLPRTLETLIKMQEIVTEFWLGKGVSYA